MSTNQYGLDADYFRRKLERVLRDVNSYRPDEMARELARMARTADEAVLREPEFSLAQAEQQPVAAVAGLPQWEQSLSSAWPADAEDAQGAWVIGVIDEEENKYPVATIEADQYDAPGDSEKIARAIIALWAQAFSAPVAKAEPAEQWISVEDRLPDVGQAILMHRPSGMPFCGKYSPLGEQHRCLDPILGMWWEFDIWMPAPTLPTRGGSHD